MKDLDDIRTVFVTHVLQLQIPLEARDTHYGAGGQYFIERNILQHVCITHANSKDTIHFSPDTVLNILRMYLTLPCKWLWGNTCNIYHTCIHAPLP